MNKIDLDKIPVLEKRQDSVSDQMADLKMVANKLGMHDAADAIAHLMPRLPDLKYGCHIEPWDGIFPTCVIDDGELYECVYANDGMRKEHCEYWRIIKRADLNHGI